jgi:exopolysaccharide biosynthesis polyprenyl glycosylphosphotransferase
MRFYMKSNKARRSIGKTVIQLYKLIFFILLVAIVVGSWLVMQERYLVDGKTTIVLTAIHALCLGTLLLTYHALDVGKKRTLDLVIGQLLSVIISDAASLLSASLVLKTLPHMGVSAVALLCQGVVCVLWSASATGLYNVLVPAKRVAVLYSDERAYESMGELHLDKKRYRVVTTVDLTDTEKSCADIVSALPKVEGVFLCGLPTKLRNDLMSLFIKENVTVYLRPKISDIFLNTAQRRYMFHIPMMSYDSKQHSVILLASKRLIDILISLPLAIIALPIMLITAIAIKAEDHGPVLYKQDRLTKGGKIFKIMKFRSMRVDAEKDGVARLASESDDRITKVGRFIRATRIDELPQLLNILKGDMSLVGPRPERPEIAEQYEKELPEFHLRLRVKAGLTGYAQIHGKYNTTPYDKLQMDLIYINDMSVPTDIKLLLQTMQTVFQKESTEGVKKGQTTASKEEKK